jgi:hypothetical protein
MNKVLIKTEREDELAHFLESNGFTVEELSNDVFRVHRGDELPVFLKVDDKQTQDLLLSLLALNTEILPVSVGIDTSNPDDHHLVLVESRETGDLSDHELLAVFDALELAVDRVTTLLRPSVHA